MRWHHLLFRAGSRVAVSDVVDELSRASRIPLSIRIIDSEARPCKDSQSVKLLDAVGRRRELTVFLAAGEISGWMSALAVACDLIYATASTAFSFTAAGERTAGRTAELLGLAIGRARTMALLMEGEVAAAELHFQGLVAGLVGPEQLDSSRLVEEFFSSEMVKAAERQKRLWRSQRSGHRPAALALERLRFAECFREGAAESVARYLRESISKT